MDSLVNKIRFAFVLMAFALMLNPISANAMADKTECENMQDAKRVSRQQAIRDQRDAFFVVELELTPDEAKKFLPLINEMYDKRYKLWSNIRKQRRELESKGNMSDRDVENLIDNSLNNSVEEAKLEKEYYEKFKRVLPMQKVAMIRPTERKYARVYRSY